MTPVLTIAEAGSNHNKDLPTALKLIDAAIAARADVVKFQTYSSETLYSRHTPDFAGHTNIPALIKKIQLPREWQQDLKKYCENHGIEFMSTPFDERAVDELYELGVKRYKIAGFEASDPRFVQYVAATQLPLIITAGIGVSLELIGNIIDWVKEVNPLPDLTFLHGNNAYPTPYQDINLDQIKLIKERYPEVTVGLSDHTEGILAPPLAVMAGATVIEKHFTLSRSQIGPDHHFAIEPHELVRMVANIRIAELCRGTKDGISTSEEKELLARRSVVTRRAIKEGEVLSADNVTTKRPALAGSIPALEYYKVLGGTAARDIGDDSVVMWEDVYEG